MLITIVKRALASATEGRSLSFQDVWGQGLDLIGPQSAAGKTVTQDTALQVSAVYGCVRILSDALSTLPVDAFQRLDGVRKPLRPRPTWLDHPNVEDSRIDLFSQVAVSLLLDGNAYLATTRDAAGSIVEVWALDPAAVEPTRLDMDGRRQVVYVVEGRPFGPSDILHVRGMMRPGSLKGVSPIRAAQETIGLALAAQEYGARFFSNGALPGGLVEVPSQMSDAGIRQLKAAWNDLHRGSGNAHRLAVLTEGARFAKVSLSPDEAQFLETRAFQVPDIARIYGVPPHLLADASGSTSWGSGLAEQGQAFAIYSIRPWAERIEAAFTRLLHSEGYPTNTFVKLNLDGFMRGAGRDRIESYAIGLQQGIFTLDEVRAWEDLPPVPDGKGKTHRIPLNLGPVDDQPRPSTRSEEDQ